ncbi:DUF3553 domain-containing protein [uncultured Nisaea sp.]|jgi:FKBP-type peptidyl-prolyl cis-trans isomerase 2|uniref:DUF3553 domain-containing protein n=1 Tax=uncultured Nisaea sp. TaxID=538215 RepID=UPI0030EE374E|tara:strand:- start:321 stop:524 length:204 start_codon:yes stop_codon:yes gene_type:complete
MPHFLLPGSFVLLADEPDWGIGQIQSVVGDRVTVNFEHRGKQLINSTKVDLIAADDIVEERRAARFG